MRSFAVLFLLALVCGVQARFADRARPATHHKPKSRQFPVGELEEVLTVASCIPPVPAIGKYQVAVTNPLDFVAGMYLEQHDPTSISKSFSTATRYARCAHDDANYAYKSVVTEMLNLVASKALTDYSALESTMEKLINFLETRDLAPHTVQCTETLIEALRYFSFSATPFKCHLEAGPARCGLHRESNPIAYKFVTDNNLGATTHWKHVLGELQHEFDSRVADEQNPRTAKPIKIIEFPYSLNHLMIAITVAQSSPCADLDELTNWYMEDLLDYEGRVITDVLFKRQGIEMAEIFAAEMVEVQQHPHASTADQRKQLTTVNTNLNAIADIHIGTHMRAVPDRLNATRRGDSNTLSSAGAATEISYWKLADAHVHKMAETDRAMTDKELQSINSLLRTGKVSAPGFRRTSVVAGDSDSLHHFYLPWNQVETQVAAMLTWLNGAITKALSKESHIKNRLIVEIANDAYVWFVSIHPFADANGRTAKMLGDYVLMRGGLPPCPWAGKYAMFPSLVATGRITGQQWKLDTMQQTTRMMRSCIEDWADHVGVESRAVIEASDAVDAAHVPRAPKLHYRRLALQDAVIDKRL